MRERQNKRRDEREWEEGKRAWTCTIWIDPYKHRLFLIYLFTLLLSVFFRFRHVFLSFSVQHFHLVSSLLPLLRHSLKTLRIIQMNRFSHFYFVILWILAFFLPLPKAFRKSTKCIRYHLNGLDTSIPSRHSIFTGTWFILTKQDIQTIASCHSFFRRC